MIDDITYKTLDEIKDQGLECSYLFREGSTSIIALRIRGANYEDAMKNARTCHENLCRDNRELGGIRFILGECEPREVNHNGRQEYEVFVRPIAIISS